MTWPENHEAKARHVKATWGKRCDVLLFMSTAADDSLPTVVLNGSSSSSSLRLEGRDKLWGKTKAAFRYVYSNYVRVTVANDDRGGKNDNNSSYGGGNMSVSSSNSSSSMSSSDDDDSIDWYLKADDDTYVIVENLRRLLARHDPDEPTYFGRRYRPFVKQGYMSGGAGYVLSRKSVQMLVEKGLSSSPLSQSPCRRDDGGAEDVEMGICLENIGVKAVDSRDSSGRERFFPFVPEHHLRPNRDPNFWYWKYVFYDYNDELERRGGLNCCSETAVSFHYVSPDMMYVLEYLIYRLKKGDVDGEGANGRKIDDDHDASDDGGGGGEKLV